MTAYSVGIVSRPGYSHSECFREVSDALQGALHDLGHEVRPPGALKAKAIILGPHLLQREPPIDSVLFNLEQVDPDSPWLTPSVIDLFRRYETWDYSAQNVNRFRHAGIHAKHVPIGYHPCLSRIEQIEAPDIDVLFYGSVNERRSIVLDELRRRGAKVHHAFNVYGSERDDLISRSKIVLNMHYYNSAVFEIVRCSYLMANRACIVSETPVASPFKAGIAWADYRGLADRCVDLLAHEEERLLIAAGGYNAIRAHPQAEYLRAVTS